MCEKARSRFRKNIRNFPLNLTFTQNEEFKYRTFILNYQFNTNLLPIKVRKLIYVPLIL